MASDPGGAQQGGFEAFTDVVIATLSRKIESLCVWQDHVLAGLQDGTLIFFKQPAAGRPGQDGKGEEHKWQVRMG